MLNSDEFYSNEKLVYSHIALFVVFTIIITAAYSITFILELTSLTVAETEPHSENYYRWMFWEKVLECAKSIVVNIIGYVMLYMLLKYSQSHHRNDF